MDKPGRNDPCPCGSGKKYKQCCMNKSPLLKRKFSVKKIEPKAVATPPNLMERAFGDAVVDDVHEGEFIMDAPYEGGNTPPPGKVSNIEPPPKGSE